MYTRMYQLIIVFRIVKIQTILSDPLIHAFPWMCVLIKPLMGHHFIHCKITMHPIHFMVQMIFFNLFRLPKLYIRNSDSRFTNRWASKLLSTMIDHY